MASLRLDRLAMRYPDGTEAVRPLSLTVPDGEFLVLMGPSGSGKSTLLRLIAGLETPTEGRVWLGGTDVTAVPPAERDVAMVFQSYALYPHMTVAENLGFALKMRRVPPGDRAEQVQQVAEQLRLTPLLERRPKDLSGGEQQRVALGRALIRRPTLFLLDEPLSNLDASLRATVRDEIRHLHAATGTTMLYVTHDQQEAISLAQRLAVMQNGVLLQAGSPDALYRQPAALDVARALGHPPINCAQGRPATDAGTVYLETEAGALPLPAWAGTQRLPNDVVLGVRPEHVTLRQTPGANTVTLAMRYVGVEGAGPDRVAWLEWGALRWAARLPADAPLPELDAPLAVAVQIETALLFDAATGAAVLPPAD